MWTLEIYLCDEEYAPKGHEIDPESGYSVYSHTIEQLEGLLGEPVRKSDPNGDGESEPLLMFGSLWLLLEQWQWNYATEQQAVKALAVLRSAELLGVVGWKLGWNECD